jgi:Mrp family chromosome partitioning ATPase
MITEKQIIEALRGVMDPELNRNLVELGMIHDVVVEKNGTVSFTVALTAPGCPLKDRIGADAEAALKALKGVKAVQITFRGMTDAERRAAMQVIGGNALPKINQFNQVKQVIAVMSGKGGVGKSSVTAGLAVALKRACQNVGILDADITGPSIPRLFKLPSGGLRSSEQGMLPAVSATGIKIVSANLLLAQEDTPIIWRGPMISGTIKQFWTDVLWGKLDTLLVDLPPGTSDAAISVVQNLPLNGVVLVTTPQELAAMVVRKAFYMLKELKIPILGVVENMSYFPCPDTGKEHYVFGPSHVEEIALAAGVPVWAKLPLDPQIAVLGDAGRIEELEFAGLHPLAAQLMEMVKGK